MANPPYTNPRDTNVDPKSGTDRTFNKLADVAADKLQAAVKTTEQYALRLAEQGQDAGAHLQEVAGNLKGAVDRSIKDQPNATLAMAAVIGFVLGAIWKT